MKKYLLLFFIFTHQLASAQSEKVDSNGKPRVWLFFQKKLHISSLMPSLVFFARNKVFHRYKSYVSPLNKEKWELTFIDNFDSLDTKKWRLGQAWGEFHPGVPHQHYSSKQIYTDSGFLYLNGAYEPKQFRLNDSAITIPYGVGLLNSDVSFMQKYGYFEIRCKNPAGPATWPAFWLTAAHSWPPEIDIFEMYGKRTGRHVHKQFSTIHFGVNGKKSKGQLRQKIWLPKDTDTSFHVYACKWTERSIKYYTDGILTRTQHVNKWLRRWMNDEMTIIINNGFEAAYLQYLPKDFKRNSFVVDWVRVYRRL